MGACHNQLVVHGVVAAVAVLCGFSIVSVAGDEDNYEPAVANNYEPAVAKPEEADAGGASAANGASAADRAGLAEGASEAGGAYAGSASNDGSSFKGTASRVTIGIGPNDPFPFGPDSDEKNPDEVLFEDGEATDRFGCEGAANLAVEQPNLAVRRLSIWRARNQGLLANFGLGGGKEDDQQEPDIWVTDGQLRVFSDDGQQESSSVLLAGLESPLPNGTRIQAGEADDRSTELAVQYDCRQEGRAIVELRLRAASSDGSSGAVCMRWVKECKVGWHGLKIEEGDNVVFKDGQLQEDWVKRMTSEGTHQPVTKFVISVDGIEQIRRPMVSSNQKLLSVDLAGPLTVSERNEVSKDPMILPVMYNCLFDGFADVTLVLEKETFSEDDPERLVITYRKTCGVAEFKHVDVHIKSEKYKNRTQAVSGGMVLPGFARPCKKNEQAMPPALRHHQDMGEHCETTLPVLTISEKELRTVLELETDKLAGEFPAFSPQADVTYDNKVLRVAVLQAPFAAAAGHTTTAGKMKKYSHARRQSLTLKYTCYKDQESTIMLTLHVLSYKSINIAWRKKCVEPKAKVGKALTAPQAIMVSMFVCGLIVAIGCLIFAFGGGKEEQPVPDKKSYKRAATSDVAGHAGGDVEMPSKIGAPDEVVFHT